MSRRAPMETAGVPEDAYDYRAWTRRAARPIWYWLLPRLLDWWNGRRDGRHGIPWFEPPAVTGPPAEPPYVRYLWARAEDSVRVERLRSQARVVREEARRRRLRTREADLGQELATARNRRSAMPDEPGTDFLASRRMAEDRDNRPAGLSRARRANEHRRALLRQDRLVRAAAAESGTVLEAIAKASALIEAEGRVLAARESRIHEHIRRRAASYWRHVLRHHPNGSLLSRHLDTAGQELPAWAEPSADAWWTAADREHSSQGGQP